MKADRGAGEWSAVFALSFVLVVAFSLYQLVSNTIGGERDGVVKYDDCRETITIEAGDVRFFLTPFTCTVKRTMSGKRMDTFCVHVETTQTGMCVKAYAYTRPPEVRCPETAPFLDADDKCYATYENGRVIAGHIVGTSTP